MWGVYILGDTMMLGATGDRGVADRGLWLKRIVAAAVLTVACIAFQSDNALAQIFISKEREKQMGRDLHPKVLEEFGGAYTGSGVDAYVAQLGAMIANFSNDPDVGYTFTVVNSPIVNAFALPGGYVYLSRGTLAIANSEAEIAGVLGHEIGHVTERHMAKRFDREIGVGIIGAVVGAVGGSDLVTEVLQRSGSALIRSFSREQEYEADLVGVRALADAGYDPYAQADFLDSLAKERELVAKITGTPFDPNRGDFFSTHPNTGKRVKRAIEEAGRSASGPSTHPRKRDAYLNRIDGILYGDDPAQGFIRGRTFSHPTLRLTFTVPERFYLTNTTTAVYANGPDSTAMRLTADRIRSSDSIGAYLRNEYGARRNIRIQDIQTFRTKSGMPGATGTYRVQSNSGTRNLRFVALQYSGSQAYLFTFISSPSVTQKYEPLFRETAMSFRKLSTFEAGLLKPLRLKVVAAGPSDTVQSLANRMAFRRFKEDQFRFINSLDDGEGVVAGQLYKIVTE